MSSSTDLDDAMKEGFLCPICLRDLGDIVQLQSHFAEAHQSIGGISSSTNTASDAADFALTHMKDFFGRAKQRILKFESTLASMQMTRGEEIDQFQLQQSMANNSSSTNQSAMDEMYVRPASPQGMGPTTSHSAYLKRIRDARVDQCAVETNKLIIRLDKLITEAPVDPHKRKGILQETFERETVQWANDSDVQFCRDCGGKFSLTKRRHHCRLCGRIVCAPCSQFLTFAYARKLTNPAYAAGYQAASATGGEQSEKKEESKPAAAIGISQRTSGTGGSPNTQLKIAGEKLLSTLATKLKRDGSEVSLSSLFNQEGEDQLRICKECKHLLENRDQQVEHRTQPPVITQMYERLRSSMEEAARLFPSYCEMAESLCTGESVYDLETATDVRMRLLKVQEQIDFLSKRIATLGFPKPQTDESGEAAQTDPAAAMPTISPRQQMLQRNVRHFAAAFLQDIAYNTPALPTPTEYAKLQATYKQEMEMRIKRERATAAAAAATAAAQSQRLTDHGPPQAPAIRQTSSPDQRKLLGSSGGGNTDAGWTPDQSTVAPTLFRFNPFDDDQPIDPLREQILLIKGFIKQAAVAGRLDEVRTLERNLRELEEELKNQNAAMSPRE